MKRISSLIGLGVSSLITAYGLIYCVNQHLDGSLLQQEYESYNRKLRIEEKQEYNSKFDNVRFNKILATLVTSMGAGVLIIFSRRRN